MSDRIKIQHQKTHTQPNLLQQTRGFEWRSPTQPQIVTEQGHDISRISLRPQAKLTVSHPEDQYEQEAEQVANQVMNMTSPVNPQPILPEVASEDEEALQMKALLQRSADSSFQTSNDLESQLNATKGGGSPLSNEVRAFMEPRFGADFSAVKVHTGSAALQRNRDLGAQAFTYGNDIYFGSGHSPGKNNLTAHELAHVVQQTGVVQPQIQRFAPPGHESATARGLAENFSAEEIGAVYQSNWERDFSQGSPKIADMVIAWKLVKASAAQNAGNPSEQAAATFRDKVWQVIDMNLTEATDESLSGYQYWEHMDNPGEGSWYSWNNPRKDADKRWKDKANGLPGYINDSKAYIKDQIVAAVDTYRSCMEKGKIGAEIDNWKGVEKPKEYDTQAISNAAWIGDKNAPALDRGVIAEETKQQAENAGAKSKVQADWEKTLWQAIGHHLGRAMHSAEDFFAHSNWLEIAQVYKNSSFMSANTTLPALRTGTFEMPDKSHALGHKLVALSGQLLADFDLLLKIYNRTKESTKLNSKNILDAAGEPSDSFYAFSPLETDSMTPVGEMLDVGIAADNMEEMIQSGKYEVADFVCNREWLETVKNKGMKLIEEGEKEAPETGHGKLAKDQDEPGKEHNQALLLAVKANEMVFGPLRQIMDMGDVDAAKEALMKQLEMVDQMIAMPSDAHPLIGMIPPMGPGDFPLPDSDTKYA